MDRRILLALLIMVTSSYCSQAQHHFGLKLIGGLSRISSDVKIPGFEHQYPSMLCGQFGAFYQFDLNSKGALGAVLGLSQIRGEELVTTTFVDSNGQAIGGPSEFSLKKYLSYLNLALFYTARMDQTQLQLGFQISRLLYSDATESFDGYNLAGEAFSYVRDYELEINPFDIGPRLALTYRISPQWELHGEYYYGLSNVLRGKSSFRPKWQNRYTAVGVNYYFKARHKNKENIRNQRFN